MSWLVLTRVSNPVGSANRRRLNGVLAEESIPPAEMWREILGFFYWWRRTEFTKLINAK